MVISAVLIAIANWSAVYQPPQGTEGLFTKFGVVKSVGQKRYEARAEEFIIGRREPDETLRHFYARIRAVARARANYAGHIAIVRWSCGFKCQDGVLLDLLSGNIEWMPFTVSDCQFMPGDLLAFRPDSRLLISNGSLEWRTPGKGQALDEDCRVRYFEWTNGRLRRVDPSAKR